MAKSDQKTIKIRQSTYDRIVFHTATATLEKKKKISISEMIDSFVPELPAEAIKAPD